ncbi:hypothetical protein CCR85_08200 [Rhodothalassium salexigens]|uniref:DUF2163 domain-containing protein n=1 Tax=Rhodothalassium salexigens TaxID=1086 RepID=UPI001912FD50|nr:DUF2163 domain-containing protein [Rhodothalassium salexigens]MBK5911471.1 hypothetical protein [Rhodothalassium salexigens]
MSRLTAYPKPGATDTIRRFEPAYWHVDFPLPMMATVVTTGPDSLRVMATFRTNRDLMGLIWPTEDGIDHGLYAWPRRKDYRGIELAFDWQATGIRAMDRLQGVTLTVETYQGPPHYVRLWNYATAGTPDACHIRMVLDETTRSGFHDDAPVPWHDVRRLFLSLQSDRAGRGNCSLAADVAHGATSLTIHVGDAGPIRPGDRLYILGLAFAQPFLTVTSDTTGPVQMVIVAEPVETGQGGIEADNIAPGVGPPASPIPAGAEVFVETRAPEPIGDQEAVVEIAHLQVTGPNSTLPVERSPRTPHALRMTDGFDNAYPLTPERLVDQVHRLGYRGAYVLYMGISKFHALSWDDAEERHIVDPAKPVLNAPSAQWIDDLFARLVAKGYTLIVSVSFEILHRFMPTAWMQRDHAGNPGLTGWQPPSSLIAPTVPDALAYLRVVFVDLLGRAEAAGSAIHFQIGEPWWWDGSFGSESPYIYDATTMAAYEAATGASVPVPKLTSIYDRPGGEHRPYVHWCRDRLGAATDWLVAEVRAVYPDAVSYLLVFSPQLLRPDAPLLRQLNLPTAHWRHPAFDRLQIEEYDRTVEGDIAFSERTWRLATGTLGYPLDRIDYFAGFNLRPETTWVWPRIDRSIWDAFARGPAEVYVWSRAQVMRDGWLFDQQSWPFYPDLTHLATCWRIERTDGVTLGFTAHDQALVVDGVRYRPAHAFTASQLAADAEMAPADAEMLGAIDADEITAADLAGGLYDHAEVALFLVDWSDPSLPKTILRRGTIGTITQSDASFTAELRGLAQRIQQPVIDSYAPECRVDLFSAECGVDRRGFERHATVAAVTDGSLGAVADNRVVFVDGLTEPDGWFDYGELLWLSGGNAGRRTEVRSWTAPRVEADGTTTAGRIELWEPTARAITAGDRLRLWAGCDKRLETCKTRFANVINFRGEPHVPGTDALLRYPDPR